MRNPLHIALALGFVFYVGCAESEEGTPTIEASSSDVTKSDGKDDSSLEAVFVDMRFSGELLTSSTWNVDSSIETQLLYTIGHLNGDNSVGRLDKVDLENVQTERDGELYRVTYDATMQVAWGKKDQIPANYTFTLPKDLSNAGQDKFAELYSKTCVDFGASDVDAGSMWYYYRPASYRCNLAESDIIKTEASVEISSVNTTGKYPEYHKVWEDDVLKVVAIFGKYKDHATSSSDAGISAYNSFLRTMQTDLAQMSLVTEPAEVPYNPGVELPEVVFNAELADGKRVEIVALLVDNVREAGPEFTRRYEELSTKADLIAYNGHAGLGANIRALASKGKWTQGQYAIVFMNGCDTYAYIDGSLFEAHAAVNPDDPTGTKHLDLVTNAMPAFFREVSNSTVQFIRGLMDVDQPKTFEQIFAGVDSSQVIIVTGEQDNEFVPGGGEEPEVEAWQGLEQDGAVAKGEEVRVETPTLPAGAYQFVLSGDNDADLYVRVGNEPTSDAYDCRPYKAGSEELCVVELPAPAKIYAMVQGYATSSNFKLVAAPR
ncbi:hypothetical protein FRD01_00425 [Microvenator marinus]|uniref:Peptidase C-terminal archaeal/bacterial domain-containing protein n=1 Tax=Microvenator marinus TaxID=2600177 RepID=A0A5B8XJ26_9DELT|nr:PPC domain-containing protein [Microvenator marinus]QED25750.1 hypothetical protein FRD01_00425 [Microvenator marinus]